MNILRNGYSFIAKPEKGASGKNK